MNEAVSPPERLRDSAAVHRYVARICFKTGPPTIVGAELEWLLADPACPRSPVSLDRLRTTLAEHNPPPAGSTISFEPGGQLELSSRPTEGFDNCWRSLDSDVAHVTAALRSSGITPLSTAIDPVRRPKRLVHHPRYDAMATYFARRGRVGEVMMCSTASVQVNVDAGADATDIARRWRLLDQLGPVLLAAFANSPVHAGHVTGWKSTRQRVWQRLDPPRTAPPAGSDPVTAWADYALDAPVMVVRRNGTGWVADPGLTFRQWLSSREPPTEDDLAYHLTTLFPPVRPRGWFEVRYVDAQSTQWWPVPPAVLTGLLEDETAADAALEAAAPAAGRWDAAARYGVADPVLAHSALCCFEVAIGALRRAGTDAHLVALVEAYVERYVARGRCPADDQLDELDRPTTREDHRDGS